MKKSAKADIRAAAAVKAGVFPQARRLIDKMLINFGAKASIRCLFAHDLARGAWQKSAR